MMAELFYRIDAADTITSVSREWPRFAIANGGDDPVTHHAVGTRLWRWIADETTRQVYRAVLSHVRAGTGPVRFRFRCDAPAERRLLTMEIAATENAGVDFRTQLVRSDPRAELRLIAADARRSDAMISACGWCMRVQVSPGEWRDVDDAVRTMGIFESAFVPKITHGMCPACYDTMMAALDDAEIAASGSVTVGALKPVG